MLKENGRDVVRSESGRTEEGSAWSSAQAPESAEKATAIKVECSFFFYPTPKYKHGHPFESTHAILRPR